MISNIIENRKQKEFTVKIVLGTEEEAIKKCDEILDLFDANINLVDKLKVGLGLISVKVNDVFNSVIIHYEFKSANEAKHFSSIFSDALSDDYNNLLETILIFTKRDSKQESTYEVSLNLPYDFQEMFKLDYIESVSTTKYPSIKITRSLVSHNKKKVLLVVEDFSNELVSIKLTKQGDTFHLPQQWLDIQEKAVIGVYDTKWVMDLKNFIRIEDKAIVSKSKNNLEVKVEQDLIKLDGEKSKFIEEKDYYIDVLKNLHIPKEIVILSK